MSLPIFNMRTISANGTVYLRKEDVAAYINELGGTEETDVRTRMEEAAAYINNMQPVKEQPCHPSTTPKPKRSAKR